MSKAVLISIQPKWCELIASGKKTIEVRKSKPKLERPFKCYIYCTKDKKDVFFTKEIYAGKKSKWAIPYVGNGKVIGEFVCRGMMDGGSSLLPKQSCLTVDEILDYSKGKRIYGWRIADLKIYDKPKELIDFRKPCPYTDGTYCIENKCEYYGDWTGVCRCYMEKPSRSWCYVEEGAGK